MVDHSSSNSNSESQNTSSSKIFPRNLTARAAYQVVGNPVSTRLESGVGNCYPGLEANLPSLDRRFFPGLVFNYIDLVDNEGLTPYTDSQKRGARLLYIDVTDPEIAPDDPKAADLLSAYQGAIGVQLAVGEWYLASIEQRGKRISLTGYDGLPLQGLVVWRMVSSLQVDAPVTIELQRRDKSGHDAIRLQGWRRRYVDAKTGVVSAAYTPGELGQFLCSPWTHDFRDCACHYWAANHPDVVQGVIQPEDQILPQGKSGNPIAANTALDWLREDRATARGAEAMNTIPQNRPFQFDHFQINQRWEELNIVLQNHEIDEVYHPVGRNPETQGVVGHQSQPPQAKPFANPEELAAHLRYMASLELALALEYLYARYSIKTPEQVEGDRWPTLKKDVTLARHFLMLIAASEMTHLRWANQLLWGLYHAGLIGFYEPVLQPATEIPVDHRGHTRPRALRPLFPEVLQDFIAVEAPSGYIEGAYARVVATLRQPDYQHLDHLYELAVQVDTDGVEHFSKFQELKKVLQSYCGAEPHPYLRTIRIGTEAETHVALELYHSTIIPELAKAYLVFSMNDFREGGRFIHVARAAMTQLNQVADALGAEGIGIPFWF